MTDQDIKIPAVPPAIPVDTRSSDAEGCPRSLDWLAERSQATIVDLDKICQTCIVLPPSQKRSVCAQATCPIKRLQQLFQDVSEAASS